MRGSEKHSAAMGVAGSVLGGLGGGRRGRSLRGGVLYWGFSLLEFWGLTRGKQRDNWAFWGCRGGRACGIGGWERGNGVGGLRGDDFTRVGQPEGEAHLGLAIVEGLKVETGFSALPPEICHLGEEVLGETVGCGSPLCWGPRHQELWP